MKLSKLNKKYLLSFQFRDGRCRLVCFENEKASIEIKRTIQKLVDAQESGDGLSAELQRLVDVMPSRIVKKLAEIGVLSKIKISGKNALDAYITNFIDALKLKRVCRRHLLQTERKLKKIFADCEFKVLSDMNPQRFISYVNGLVVAVKTKKTIIAVMKQFSKWLYDNDVSSKDAFKLIQLPKVLKSDQVHPRRPLSAVEVGKLIYAAENGEPFRGVSGQERALIYRLAVESGLRANELKSLKVNSFDFKSSTVKILDSDEKARRGAVLELRKSTADTIKDFLRHKSPQAAAFTVKKTSMMIKIDLASAGIPYKLDGQFADFHALRHSTASLLIASGANIKAIQTIMRHSTADLTLSKYSHLYAGQQRDAIENLPDFIVQENQSIKTGTCDENLLPNICHFTANEDAQSHIVAHNYQNNNKIQNTPFTATNSIKMAFSAVQTGTKNVTKKIGETGFEPATSTSRT